MIFQAAKNTRVSRALIIRMTYVALCLIVPCAISSAYETEYFDWKGLQFYAVKNYTAAIEQFDKAIAQDPNYVDGWVHKADAQRALKDYNASLKNYSCALDIDRNKTTALSGIVVAYTAQKDYANASVAAARLTEIGPKNKANWLQEGNLLQMQGLYNESRAKYEGALAIDKKYKDALYREGISYMALGDDAQAIGLFDQALQIDPNYKQALNAKGLALEGERNYADALYAYDEALDIDPKWTTARANRAQALLALGRLNDSMREFVNT
ncbi:MAG: lipoprotein NlpI [Methanosaeta sp. PtaU1.Bin060]|nr:MAG: lipoprotein NlpI [Methanosaeta sp. PtaU1.Bin060]